MFRALGPMQPGWPLFTRKTRESEAPVRREVACALHLAGIISGREAPRPLRIA